MARLTKKDQAFLEAFHGNICSTAHMFLGAHHLVRKTGEEGFLFRVWAPNATAASVVGDFNDWKPQANPMKPFGEGGIWECFIPALPIGTQYKYCLTAQNGNTLLKMDPYGYATSPAPDSDSVTAVLEEYSWQDADWMQRRRTLTRQRPINIYQVHLGSWRRGEEHRYLTYDQLAELLPAYVQQMGYNYIELMPLMEHTHDGAWGYRTTNYFAPTCRYGSPHGLMHLIDACHRAGIGVIMDWNVAHFPKDSHGLIDLDGGCCYEYSDPMKQEHSQWDTRVFDFGREEVRSFLVSNAMFWLGQYHLDGLRLNNVSSMLYLDYGRENWQWTPNIQGGRENLEAVSFLQALNTTVLGTYPGVLMIAEEFSPWPNVTRPASYGGLGFTHRWNVGWTNDMMQYFSLAPAFRSYNQDKLTFGSFSAFGESYILPLSHEEFVFGKRSLLEKLPGLPEEKLAGLRSFFALMLAYPGKKMTFMGCELGQLEQWNHRHELQWFLQEDAAHHSTQQCIADLNRFYLSHAPLWQNDESKESFYWIDAGSTTDGVFSFVRMDEEGHEILVVCNFSDQTREYQMGLPEEKCYRVVFDTNSACYGGTAEGHALIQPQPYEYAGFDQYARLTLAPYSACYLIAQ